MIKNNNNERPRGDLQETSTFIAEATAVVNILQTSLVFNIFLIKKKRFRKAFKQDN